MKITLFSMPLYVIFFIALLVASPVYSNGKPVTYPASEGAALNNDFKIQVRQPGQQRKDSPSYLVKVDEVKETNHHVENASMGCFDSTGEVEVSVTYNHGAIRTAKIRPLSYNITPEINRNTLIFKLDRPCNLSVEINDDK